MSSTTTSGPSPVTTTASATTSCVSAVPDRYGHVPYGACDSYYAYYPSFIFAIVGSVLFGAVTLAQIMEAFLLHKGFAWTIIMGSIWETASFVLRALGAHHQQNIMFAAASQILLLLAPVWINAYAYMVAGRMIYFFLPEQEVFNVKARSLTKYFVWLDVLSFVVQMIGGSMLSPNASPKQLMTGIHVYMGGIGLQQAFMIFFLAIIFRFHQKMAQLERTGSSATKPHWRWLTAVLCFVLTMITVRIIYRLLEYSRGTKQNNPLPFHEVYAYTLDALPMFLATLVLSIIHPGFVLVGPGSEFAKISRREKKAMKRERKERKRAGKRAPSESRSPSGSWDHRPAGAEDPAYWDRAYTMQDRQGRQDRRQQQQPYRPQRPY